METFWNQLGEPEEQLDELLWEVYHENSKLTTLNKSVALNELQAKTLDLIVSQDYAGFPKVALPDLPVQPDASLWQIMHERTTARTVLPKKMDVDALATLLYSGYGINRTNADTEFPHPFRTVPSAGALYPLEIFFHHTYIEGLEIGLYHYNPSMNSISLLQRGDQSRALRDVFIQPELAFNSSAMFFVTGWFERITFKYGERGYRFALIEAGHVVQNMILAAKALGFGTVPVGGFLDHRADEFLKLDGVTASCLYCLALGDNQDNA
ncbi:SagB/ThcOx family dehydrogenase [Spirosoma sp.]|uniref:SagB/ThcOx family dehydrogenase n=1 Tax=Spirosoma sp. TaxID=1899569 RepID=UPI002631696B|nr:SagB/ThcOx family dehydrogenase [Spirosoma sp.]MCX6217964.1 SagB/ThcOx family dehydrogenase [Spirosoma sp.]